MIDKQIDIEYELKMFFKNWQDKVNAGEVVPFDRSEVLTLQIFTEWLMKNTMGVN